MDEYLSDDLQRAGHVRGGWFVASFPPMQDGATGHPDSASSPGAGRAGNRLNLLVVDDNADAAYTLAMLLEAYGHAVNVEIDPRVALNRAEVLAPDVFILDIGMPHIDGYELARRIRTSALGTRPVLIALTGYGQPEDKRRALDAGFDYHLVKPLDPSVLTALLERMTPNLRH